ncbi:hypothetical protein N8J89_11560 [Crossiella sp. CA-258035]|uniref:hypothetical protein n=1 Tax=Crossiella sp. CA-258035 TaxID=2981138 RepID=UPI0024BC4F56|nr:hypothetical protein [Crossiella sp. CA-258035]WHT21669.1 hypothetical protein N8J89_11560 [Crossiella sp. CA-258035]
MGTPPPDAALHQALSTGPFHLAFRLAIRRSGLGIEGVSRRLHALGLPVSTSSLSYWQRGNRRPEREESLNAVRAVEELAGLPADSLVALLGPRRPRGRWLDRMHGRPLVEQSLELTSPVRLPDLDTGRANAQLRQLKHDWLCLVDASRCEVEQRVRQVFVALEDGVDRFLAFQAVPPGGGRPVYRPVSDCRIGRQTHDPDSGLFAVEIVFDHVLRAGETYAIETVQLPPPGQRDGFLQYGCRAEVRELLLRVRFDPAELPVRCHRYRTRLGGRTRDLLADVPPGPSGSAHHAVLDAEPGIYGLAWEWDG